MKTITKILSVVLCLTMVIGLFTVGASAAETYVKVTDGNLTSGQYVLVSSNGYAPGVYDNGWVTAVEPTVSGESVTDAAGAVWTLTVDGSSVKITDANGVTIAPKGGNNNGIKDGDYSWTWSFADGEFTFDGVGADTVRLAGNVDYENKYRGYKTTTVTGTNADKYPSTFTLYKKAAGGSTTPSEPVTPPTPSEPVTPPVSGDVALQGGMQVVIYAPAYNKALSSLPSKEGSFYQLGVDVALDGATLTGYSDTEIWTVVANSDGSFSFEQNGQKLGMQDSYSSMSLGAVNDKWTVSALGNGVYNITNTVRGNSIEWYNSQGNWSTYNKNIETDDQYHLSFYDINGGTVTPPVDPDPSEPTPSEPTPSEPTPSEPASTLPPVTAPVAGTAYKFGMIQVKTGNTVYIAGGIDQDRFLITTTDKNAALDVYVEASGDGYKFAVTIDGAKQYITLGKNSADKIALSYGAEGSVFVFNAEISAWVTNFEGSDYYIGSYNTFDTMSASKTSYINADNKGVDQFPAGFFAASESSDDTSDNSFISVAAAALILSVLGGTALVIKKKEN